MALFDPKTFLFIPSIPCDLICYLWLPLGNISKSLFLRSWCISYILIYEPTNSHNKNILSFRYRKKTHATHPLTIRSRTFPTVTPHCFPVRCKCHLVLKRATKIKTRTFELSQSISLSPSKFVIIFSYLKL